MQIEESFNKLKGYCEIQKFKGWDPYDGLNSKLFQATPLKRSALARLILIQTFKRNPINLRTFFGVPKQYNAKGIALFLTGYCNLYTLAKNGTNDFGTPQELLRKIKELAGMLISLQSKGYSGACWGYNFDWQARRLFLFPKDTPTVVATSFAVTALFKAYEITKKSKYLDIAISSGKFIINDLHRTKKEKGFLFSYSPLDGNNTVYNASLLGSKTLALCYHYTGNENYKDAARGSVEACVTAQQKDGSWVYGELPVQNWVDSFHTGYNLEALAYYQKYTGDIEFKKNIEKGFEFYMNNFFKEDGTPKYYHNKTYPIDIHCPGQLPVTLSILGITEEYREVVDEILDWTIDNMQDSKGYFYYQLKKGISSKIPYMRWSQAFMFYAFSYYFLSTKTDPHNSEVTFG